MSISNHLRIKDKKNPFYKNRQDFLVRQFGISSGQVIKFLIATLAIIAAVPFLVYRMYRDDLAELGYSGSHAWLLSGCMTALLTGIVLYSI